MCSSCIQRTSQSCLNHSQEPCEWVDAGLGVLWVESEQLLHLKIGCPIFNPVRGLVIYPICFNSTHRTSGSQSTHSQEPCQWFAHDLQVRLLLSLGLLLFLGELAFNHTGSQGPINQVRHSGQMRLMRRLGCDVTSS